MHLRLSVFNASYFHLIFYALGSIIQFFMNFGNFGNKVEMGTLVFTINTLFYHKAALVISQWFLIGLGLLADLANLLKDTTILLIKFAYALLCQY